MTRGLGLGLELGIRVGSRVVVEFEEEKRSRSMFLGRAEGPRSGMRTRPLHEGQRTVEGAAGRRGRAERHDSQAEWPHCRTRGTVSPENS